MSTTLPPVSPQLPFVYRLDNKDSALEDWKTFNQQHVAFVILGTPDKKELILQLLNNFCSEPTADPRLRTLWIEEGEMLDCLTEPLKTLLATTFPQEPFEGIRAYTSIAGSEEPKEFLRKGLMTFNGITIKQAINRAVIDSPAPNHETA